MLKRNKLKKRLLYITITFFVLLLFSVSDVFAEIRVIYTKGRAAYQVGRSWRPLKRGLVLRQGTRVSTGFRSWAVLKVNGNYMRIKPLTLIKIYANSRSRKLKKTHIGLRRGSIRARVKRNRKIRTIFKVSTPVATSSVRGTEKDISYGPGTGMVIKVITGTVTGETLNGQLRLIGKKLFYKYNNNSSNPTPLISGLKDNSIVKVHDENITSDESKTHNFNGGDVVDTNDGSVSTIDSEIKKTEKSQVNATIVFPSN